MTVGSLCSGIGGLDLGLDWRGFEIRWQVEIDHYCRKVLSKHWPTVRRFEDVRDLEPGDLEPVDVIIGGYPCQPYSKSGRRGGSDDPRDLWPHFRRILRGLRPRYALLENVPDHLSLGFGRVLGDLAESGFDAEWGCVSAADVGAPHLRDRVFILGILRAPEVADASGVRVEGDRADWKCITRASSPPRLLGCHGPGGRRPEWEAEPGVDRMADGVPNRVDRVRALGNAVVPEVAFQIGRRIEDLERERVNA